MRVLALNPYHGGSHKDFLDGWVKRSSHDWTVLTLPARHFKWRIRQGSVGLAQKAGLLAEDGAVFDLIFTTSLLDAAELRGLLPRPYRTLPLVVYFHENQLVYPTRKTDARDTHFSLINWVSALAADAAWFNSDFNRSTFLDGLERLLRKMPDEKSLDTLEPIHQHSSVEPLGLNAGTIGQKEFGPLHIGWVARWEHDKGPRLFFDALRTLKAKGHRFHLTCLGQQFRTIPLEFEEATHSLQEEISHMGFIENRSEYEAALSQLDVVVSTATHEFFGLALMEAVGRGAIPVLPRRLVYPEIYPDACLYNESEAALVEHLSNFCSLKASGKDLIALHSELKLPELARSYDWSERAPTLDASLEKVALNSIT